MRMPAFLLAVLIPATAAAQYQTDFPAEEFKARHSKVFEQIGANAVAVLGGRANRGLPHCRGSTTASTTFPASRRPALTCYSTGARKPSRSICHRATRGWKLRRAACSAEDGDLVKRIAGVDDVKPVTQMTEGNWPLMAAAAGGREAGAAPRRRRFTRSSARRRISGRAAASWSPRKWRAPTTSGWRADASAPLRRTAADAAPARRGAQPESHPRRAAQYQEHARDRDDPRIPARGPWRDGSHAQHRAGRDRVPARCRGPLCVQGERCTAGRLSIDHGYGHGQHQQHALLPPYGHAEDGDLVLMDYAPDYRYYVSDVGGSFPSAASTTWQRELLQFV